MLAPGATVEEVIPVTGGEERLDVLEEESVGVKAIFLAGVLAKDTVDTEIGWELEAFGNEIVCPCGEEEVRELLGILGVVLVLGGGVVLVPGGGVGLGLGGGFGLGLGGGFGLVPGGGGVLVPGGGGAPPEDPIIWFETQRTCYRRLLGRLKILGLTPEARVRSKDIKAKKYDMIGKHKT